MTATRDMEWMEDAACRGKPLAVFFPDYPIRGEDCEGKRVCLPCPVKEQCLDWALTRGERGIWGATSDEERKRIRRRRGLPTPRQEYWAPTRGRR